MHLRHTGLAAAASAVLLCSSCCTRELWERTGTRERLWIPSSEITQEELARRGVPYEKYSGLLGDGYLIEQTKDLSDSLRDYTIRTLATPVTVTLDTVGSVTVVAAVVLLGSMQADPESWNRRLNR